MSDSQFDFHSFGFRPVISGISSHERDFDAIVTDVFHCLALRGLLQLHFGQNLDVMNTTINFVGGTEFQRDS